MTCDTAWDSTPRLQAKDALAALVCLVALLNTVNRLNVNARLPAGDYRPGQFSWATVCHKRAGPGI